MRSIYTALASPRMLLILLAAALAGACGSSGETLVVAERPEAGTVEQGVVEPPAGMPARGVADPALAGPFPTGRLWRLEDIPSEWFQAEYGFRPDSAWIHRARSATLRLPNCTASFVSEDGLVVTNYHCVQQDLHRVERAGEDLWQSGFLADSAGAERRIPELHADQLVAVSDVTADVRDALRQIVDDDRRAEVLRSTIERLEERMTADAKQRDTSLHVQVIELHRGLTYAAYKYKRFHDLRLVMVPEADVGGFGGDTDNFTYPRFTLDVAFLRAYRPEDERPVEPDEYFEWTTAGVDSGDVVFLTGNPGQTARLTTSALLLFERDVEVPPQVDALSRREEALRSYIERHPERADTFAVRETLESVANARKEAEGRLWALRNSELIDRARAVDALAEAATAAVDTLSSAYRSTIRQIEDIQQSKRATASQRRAFALFGAAPYESHVLIRSIYAFLYDFARQRNASADFLENYLGPGRAVEDWPPELERVYLAQRLQELRDHLGASDPTVRSILNGRTPSAVAADVVGRTALVDSVGFDSLIQAGYLGSGDPTVTLARAVVPLYLSLIQQQAATQAREDLHLARLAELRKATGEQLVPDATFSLRLSDGIVRGYEDNGTLVPPYTTLFGMYNANASRPSGLEWDLPERWLDAPPDFNRSAPLNFVSTLDITGGSSGSPVFDRNHRLVGIAFDSNMQALGNTYIYTEEGGARAIAVDTRAVTEALQSIHHADALVDELLGRTTEVELGAPPPERGAGVGAE